MRRQFGSVEERKPPLGEIGRKAEQKGGAWTVSGEATAREESPCDGAHLTFPVSSHTCCVTAGDGAAECNVTEEGD